MVNARYNAEYDNNAKVDTEFVSEEVDTEFDHKCNVKDITFLSNGLLGDFLTE